MPSSSYFIAILIHYLKNLINLVKIFKKRFLYRAEKDLVVISNTKKQVFSLVLMVTIEAKGTTTFMLVKNISAAEFEGKKPEDKKK